MTNHELAVTADLARVARSRSGGVHHQLEAVLTVACTCGITIDVFHGLVDVAHVWAMYAEHTQAVDLVEGCERLLAGQA